MVEILKFLARKRVMEMLVLIEDNDTITFGEIMFGLRINPSTLSKNIGAAMALGLVKKCADGYYSITERGGKVLAVTRHMKNEMR